jgi:PAS domain S-box-containing protein
VLLSGNLNSAQARTRLLAWVALTVTYVMVGRLGLALAVPPGYATAIFPPAGIAMAAMFIGGNMTLPWTFLGSFLLNLWIGDIIKNGLDALTLAAAFVIATASMVQAGIGGWTLRRLIGYPTTLDNGRDLARFFLSVPIFCQTSATLSLSAMAVLGVVKTPEIISSWLTWWLGDTLGIMLCLPLVMVVCGEPRNFWRRRMFSVALPMLLFFGLFAAIFIQVSVWEMIADHRLWQSTAVLMIGVLSTCLLGALLMLGSGDRQRSASLLTERTRERDRIWQVSEDLLGVGNFEGYYISVNPAWTKTLGWSEDEIKTLHVNELLHPDDATVAIEGRRRLAEGTDTVRLENRYRHKDDSYRWIYWTLTVDQGLIYVVGRDVTADKATALAYRQTEDQLRQLQKVEAIGQLTGGIAHDFNNLLAVIIGNLEILNRLLGTTPSDKVNKAVTAAMDGATRAATLTHRLLAYAQKQPLKPRAVALNELATGMAGLIRFTQGKGVDYEFALGENLPHCFCDANQVETALLNLVINARDAMPNGGRLTIATDHVVFDGPAADARGIAAGTYIMLAVSDTGTGMSRETVERAFEPFFTTKETGKGTGLGLSMVYGFVKQSKGYVEIDSTLGCGTTVRIFLPALAAGQVVSAEAVESIFAPRASGETILIAEDEASVRA